MPEYTISSNGQTWNVLKNGRFFCLASSKKLAEGIIVSLGNAATPRVNDFHVTQLNTSPTSSPQK